MTIFNPATALLGGALIGLASVLLMLFLGRIAGISGRKVNLATLALRNRVIRQIARHDLRSLRPQRDHRRALYCRNRRRLFLRLRQPHLIQRLGHDHPRQC